MSARDADLRPCRRPDVEAVDVDGELVLWDPLLRAVHRLDPVGSLLWPFLDGGTTVGELAEDAATVWGVSIEQTQPAVRALIDQLDAAGLLGAAGAAADLPDPRYLIDPPSP